MNKDSVEKLLLDIFIASTDAHANKIEINNFDIYIDRIKKICSVKNNDDWKFKLLFEILENNNDYLGTSGIIGVSENNVWKIYLNYIDDLIRDSNNFIELKNIVEILKKSYKGVAGYKFN